MLDIALNSMGSKPNMNKGAQGVKAHFTELNPVNQSSQKKLVNPAKVKSSRAPFTSA